MNRENPSANTEESRLGSGLWKEYIEIAQEFWLPSELKSTPRFLILLVLMMAFVASLLFLFVAATVNITHAFAPEFVARIAPGLTEWIRGLLHSWLCPVLLAGFIVPAVVFGMHGKKLRSFITPWAILGTLLLLSFTVSGLNVVISYVGRFFQTALAQKDQPTFWTFLFVYASVFVVGTPIVVIYSYIRKRLALLWREWITTNFINKYLQNKAYYRLSSESDIDNPDQRISEDLSSFTATSLSFLLIILGALIDLIAFTGILLSISRLLTGILLIYAIVGTLITILIGKRLVGLNYNQLKKEANFRYGLIHIRDNTESIAFYQGEQDEKRQIGGRFREVLKNYHILIGWQRNLDFFTTGYNYLIVILPALITAPMYFAGKIEFGQITQAAFAFSQVLAAFSIIVQYFDSISSFAASINRVSTFKERLTTLAAGQGSNSDGQIHFATADTVTAENLTLNTPDDRQTLIKDLTFTLKESGSVLIMGPSGAGKSSLLRGIAGLWRRGSGCIAHPPAEQVLFLPQKPYMILGSLRDQLQYPSGTTLSNDEVEQILEEVNLTSVYQKLKADDPALTFLDSENNWEKILSQGEQQRLAFARLLVTRPKFAILDEATSALDVANEKALYDLLAEMKIPYISVGHRPTLKAFHNKVLTLEGKGEWSLKETTN